MRWESGKPRYRGQTRTITEFLWFPRKVNHEWRWLERAKISQVVYEHWGTYGDRKLYWEDVKWVDEKEEVKLK